MKHSLKILWTSLWLCLWVAAGSVVAQDREVKQIRIVSDWVGLGPSGHSELSIERKSGGYRAKGKRVDDKLVTALLDALNTPPVAQPELANLGITQDWLNANAELALQTYSRGRSQEPADNQKALFSTAFKDMALMEKLLPELIGGRWTDDYPAFEMEIVTSDGRTIKVFSQRQPVFMLPWIINNDGQEYGTYNANLSKAIANLLPSKFTNRGRLSGKGLLYSVAEKVLVEIEPKWNRLDTENKIGAELEILRDRYVLEKTAISYLSSIDVGHTWEQIRTREPNFPSWNAKLQRKDLPANVVIGISLPFKEGKLPTFNLFRERIDGFVAQALSVPWLADAIQANPNTKFEIRFVQDRSFSELGEQNFREVMKRGGKEAQAQEISGLLAQSSFLTISESGAWSRWLVLPDKRMVLWDFQGDTVLKWKASDFATWKRFNDSKNWYGAFSIISANGQIEVR